MKLAVELSDNDRAQWAKHFACRTPNKIRVQIPFATYFECRGCSGVCGCSHFDQEPQLKQELLFA